MKIGFETIISRNNPKVKWAASLADKKGRAEACSFIAEGEKLTLEALASMLPVTHIFVNEEKKERIAEKLKPYAEIEIYKNTEVIFLSESAFSKISTEKSPQGVISVIKYLDFFGELDIIYKEEFCFSEDERLLVLCSVRDPGNLGSVIRSAVAFGVDRIVLTRDAADVYNPKTVRSAMGSLFKVKMSTVSSLENFVQFLKSKGRRVFTAELTENAKPLSEISLGRTDTVIIGNEGHGIPSEISALATSSVYIPISAKTESLNASVAAAIFMWEQAKN